MVARIFIIAVGLMACFIPVPADWVERYYSRGAYARLQPLVTGVSNRVPFAIFDVLLVGALIVLVVAVGRAIGRAWRARSVSPLGRFVLGLLAVVAVVYLAFLGMWGLNYRREPLSHALASTGATLDTASAVRLGRDAVAQLNRLHGPAHREGFPDWDRVRPMLEPTYRRLLERLEAGRQHRPGLPKWSLLTYFFDRAGVSGMTDPFFLEVLVDRELLPFERPFVLAHEWSHLAGYADEAEANFVGWVICVNARAPAAYSGWLYLYSQALAAVPRDERPALVRALGAGPRADLTAVAEHARRIQPALSSASWEVYDRYLKANRVAAGVASYDRALLLVVNTRFENGWMPVVK